MDFEHHSEKLLPKEKFYWRIVNFTSITFFFLSISLGIGVVGYHYLNDLPWLDALVNASMILTGMGPVDPLKNEAAKWFASLYAIFSGVAFLTCVAVFLSPMVHRFLHKLHIDETSPD